MQPSHAPASPARRLQLIRREPLREAVELAVRRALAQNFPGQDPAVRERLIFDLQREFNYLLRRMGKEVAGTTKSALLQSLDDDQRRALEARDLARLELDALREQATDTRAQHDARVAAAQDAEDRARLRRVLAARKSESDVYERRIAKLVHALEETERELALRQRQALQDEGLASVYEDVQGLDERGPRAALKLDLLRDIYEANLALQRN